LGVKTEKDGDHEVAKELACCGVHKHLPPAPTFDIWYADEGEEKVGD